MGCGRALQEALHGPEARDPTIRSSDPLETVRSAARMAGHPCRLRSGASMFLYPDQYPSVLSTLRGVELRPHHIVVAQAFLPILVAAISQIPSKHKIRVDEKKKRQLAEIDEDSGDVFVIARGFYDAPRLLRAVDSVTQSTSEIPPNRVTNARRYAGESIAGWV